MQITLLKCYKQKTRLACLGQDPVEAQSMLFAELAACFWIASKIYANRTTVPNRTLMSRAAAVNPTESRLVGIRVAAMLALGWGLAAMLGAVAGVMAAPSLFLEPNMMQTVLLYAFAAAVLGGMDSPIGAVVGGLLLGVLLNLAGTYVHWIGGELRLATALVVILGVLLLRPSGLFGRAALRRV